MAAFALPGVEPDVVVIAAGRNERGARAQALLQLEAEHAAVKAERAIEIGDLEMDMPDPRAGDDGWILGHGEFSVRLVLYPETVVTDRDRSATGPVAKPFVSRNAITHASSDTSPAGSSNSNVFSVIDTMV